MNPQRCGFRSEGASKSTEFKLHLFISIYTSIYLFDGFQYFLSLIVNWVELGDLRKTSHHHPSSTPSRLYCVYVGVCVQLKLRGQPVLKADWGAEGKVAVKIPHLHATADPPPPTPSRVCGWKRLAQYWPQHPELRAPAPAGSVRQPSLVQDSPPTSIWSPRPWRVSGPLDTHYRTQDLLTRVGQLAFSRSRYSLPGDVI